MRHNVDEYSLGKVDNVDFILCEFAFLRSCVFLKVDF